MPSNRTPSRIFGPAYLTTAGATLYTVPGSKIAVVRLITIVARAPDDAYLGINGLADDDYFLVKSLTTNETLNIWQYQVLVAGDTLQGGAADGDTKLVVTVNADVYDV